MRESKAMKQRPPEVEGWLRVQVEDIYRQTSAAEADSFIRFTARLKPSSFKAADF